MLRERLTEAVKEAMKAKDAPRVSTLRMVQAAIKDKDIALRGEGKPAADNQGILDLLQKMVKQRRDSIEAFTAGARPDLAEIEQKEIAIIAAFMPTQLSEAEVEAACKAVIAECGAQGPKDMGPKDMGKVMALLKEKFAGQMDFSKASAKVKQLLS
jgi:uncharacterized protein YqeY